MYLGLLIGFRVTVPSILGADMGIAWFIDDEHGSVRGHILKRACHEVLYWWPIMAQYERNALLEGEQEAVSFPAFTEAPTVIPYSSEEGAETTTVSMDQQVNEELYSVGEDGNPIHYESAYAEAYGDATPFFDVPEEETVIQGSAFLYEAIRNADDLVDHVSSEFRAPVFTGDAVRLERTFPDKGEEVTVYDAETGDMASKHTLTYEMDHELDETEVERINTVKAMKPPRAVGADDQLNNLLLGIEADLGRGEGADVIEHVSKEMKDGDEPYNRHDRFGYGNGTDVDVFLLEPDAELEDEIETAYKKHLEGEEPEKATMMSAWADYWTGMVDVWTDATTASIEVGIEMTPPYQRQYS